MPAVQIPKANKPKGAAVRVSTQSDDSLMSSAPKRLSGQAAASMRNVRASIHINKMNAANMLGMMSGPSGDMGKIKELPAREVEKLKGCFDAFAGPEGKVKMDLDEEDDDEAGKFPWRPFNKDSDRFEFREGELLYGTLHAFGLSRFYDREGGMPSGVGAGFLDREVDELCKLADDELTFDEVKTLASRETALSGDWHKFYEDINGNVGSTSGPGTPWLDPVWQLKQSFEILTGSVGEAGGLDCANLFEVLHTCGEEMDNEEFDDWLRLIDHPRSGNFNIQKLLAKIKQFGDMDSDRRPASPAKEGTA